MQVLRLQAHLGATRQRWRAGRRAGSEAGVRGRGGQTGGGCCRADCADHAGESRVSDRDGSAADGQRPERLPQRSTVTAAPDPRGDSIPRKGAG
eukprot:8738493-Pyramimonas_sp.AAC.1